jgi:hypothetical protein
VTEEGCDPTAQIGVGEAVWEESEEDEGMEEGLDPSVLKAEGGGSLVCYVSRLLDGMEGVFTDRAIMADALDVEQTSVGLEADLPECGKVVKPFADLEVAGVVDGGLGP